MRKRSHLEEKIMNRIEHGKLPLPLEEYRFHPTRKWRFDFAYPNKKIAIEAEGGVFTRGRHSRGVGLSNDCEKYNAATILGWKVLRYTVINLDNVCSDLVEILNQVKRKGKINGKTTMDSK